MEEKYFKEFQKMGILIDSLPENYDPDIFGRTLLYNSMISEIKLSYSDKTQIFKSEKEYA